MNTKLHAVTDAKGRPISFLMTAGQVSNYTGAAALLDGLSKADWLLGDRGYDANRFCDAPEEKGITPCTLGGKSRTIPIKYDKRRYKSRNRIEVMFGRLKNWRRVATRYDRCPIVFLFAVALAAAILFWLWMLNMAVYRVERNLISDAAPHDVELLLKASVNNNEDTETVGLALDIIYTYYSPR